MNRKWLIPMAAAVAAGLVAYGVTRKAVCGRSGPSVDRLQDVSFLVRELGLDNSQAMEIRRLHAALGATLNDCCTRHCAARGRLARALAADTNGSVQTDAIVSEMCRAYEQSERATLDRIRAVRAVLNAEQRRRFDTMVSDCMCKPCGMRGDSCGTDAEGMPALALPKDQKER